MAHRLLIVLIFVLFPLNCFGQISQTRFLMGTFVTITVYDKKNTEILEDAFNRLADLENTLSMNIENTLISSLGSIPTKVPKDVLELISKGIYYSDITKGSFDISIAPLVDLWRIGFDNAKLPTEDEIENVLPLINYKNIIIDKTKSTVCFANEDMSLDLGSIAKGFATDEIVKVLKKHRVKSALINLGGNVFVMGTKTDGLPWQVGIQNPFEERGDVVCKLNLSNKSIVTSGIYERYIEIGDKKYHHLLNPKTGYPFDNDIVSVTIVSDYSTDGDILSTAVFSMGIDDGLNFVEDLNNIDAIIIDKNHDVYITSGLVDNLIKNYRLSIS